MITLFKSNETDFTHNGIGNLDYHIIDPIIEEEINGLYKFTFKYPLFAPHGLKIIGQSVIRAPVPDMEDQLFRVYRPVKSMGYVTVSCYHIFYDLADNFIEDTNIVEKDGQGALQQLGGATQFNHNFRFFSDITTVANARLVRKNVVASILDDEQGNSFVNRWGGELIRNNFDVRVNESAGSDRGFEVKYRKNLTGYEADVDYSTVVTRIMPKGFDGLLLPEKYIDSPFIGNYETPKIKMIDYDVKAAIGEYADDEDAIPLEDAYKELRRLAKEEYTLHKIDIPTTSYKVDFVMLEQTEEYKDLADLQKLKIGDMVTVDHEEDDFKVTAKLVKYKYNPISKRYLLAELGSIHSGMTSTFSDIKKINREVSTLKEQTLIIQATADGKNTIYRGGAEPRNPNVGDLWYKPNGSETQMYLYVNENGVKYWKLELDTGDLTKVQKDVDAALEEVDEARDKAQEAYDNANIATQNAIESIGIAQEGFDKAQQAIVDASSADSKAQQAITKAQEGFDRAQENADKIDVLGVRIEDTEDDFTTISGTVQGLQMTVQSKVDASTYNSKMTQLDTLINTKVSKTDADNRYTQQTTFDQFADRFSTRVEKIENWEIGGRNLLKHSKGDKLGDFVSFAYSPMELSKNYLDHDWIWVRKSNNYDQVGIHTPVFNLEKNQIYTISFFIRSRVNSGYDLDYNYLRQGTSSITSVKRLSSVNMRDSKFKGDISGDGLHVWFSFSHDEDVQNARVLFGVNDRPEDAGFVVRHIKVEKGNKATDWTPAPEDTDQKFSAIEQTIDSIATRVQTTEKDYSSLSQTVEGFQQRVSNAVDDISSVTQLANTLQSTIGNKADKSEVTQLATLVDSKVTSSQVNNLIANDKQIKDTRNVNRPPSWYFNNYSKQLVRELKRNDIVGISGEGSVSILETDVPWFDASGGRIKQILYTDTATHERRSNVSVDTWQPWKKVADVDYVEGRITVLNKNINLRVTKNELINQINIDSSGILISGKKLILDGDTTVNGTFRVTNANITSLNAGKITAGTLDAANVNVININASNITTGSLQGITGVFSGRIESNFNNWTVYMDGMVGHGIKNNVTGREMHLLPDKLLYQSVSNDDHKMTFESETGFYFKSTNTYFDNDIIFYNNKGVKGRLTITPDEYTSLLVFDIDRSWRFRQAGAGVSSALVLQADQGHKSFYIRASDDSVVVRFAAQQEGEHYVTMLADLAVSGELTASRIYSDSLHARNTHLFLRPVECQH